jgi:hypothetical protein
MKFGFYFALSVLKRKIEIVSTQKCGALEAFHASKESVQSVLKKVKILEKRGRPQTANTAVMWTSHEALG